MPEGGILKTFPRVQICCVRAVTFTALDRF